MGGLSLKPQSAPPAPDYMGAARETASGNLEAAKQAVTANRVNQVTPYGNLTYTKNSPGGGFDQAGYDAAMAKYNASKSMPTGGGGIIGSITPLSNPEPNRDNFNRGTEADGWTATQTLSPEQQKILDYQNQTSLGLGSIQNQGLGYVQNMLDKPFDTSKLPGEQINAGQTAQNALMARLNPSFEGRQSQLETQMANQGIARGTEAYTNAQKALDQARNDAYLQAGLQSMGIGQQARQQGLQEQSFLRNEPLNTLNAVRTGSQVQGPQFTNVPQQATVQGPDMLGAVNAQYQAQSGSNNAGNAANAGMMGGLMNMAGTLGASYMNNYDRLPKQRI